jgi:hypothetical protein
MRKLFLLLFALPLNCFSQIILSSSTESDLVDKIKPPRELIDLILRNEPADDVALLKECAAEEGSSVAEFFSVAAIQLNKDRQSDYFIRPATQPYCFAFYGAHLFRYWFVASERKDGKPHYRIVLKNGGDEVRVLRSVSRGHHDLELVGHNAVEEDTSTWHFDGKKYAIVGCVRRAIAPDKVQAVSDCRH